MKILGMIDGWQIMSVLFFLFPILALVDILRSDFKENKKIIWVIVVVCFSFIGTIFYYLFGRKQKIKKPTNMGRF